MCQMMTSPAYFCKNALTLLAGTLLPSDNIKHILNHTFLSSICFSVLLRIKRFQTNLLSNNFYIGFFTSKLVTKIIFNQNIKILILSKNDIKQKSMVNLHF